MDDLDAKHSDVMYFCNVRWLSCGKVFNRFKDLLSEIITFLREQKLEEEYQEIQSQEWQQEMFFLCDITNHLNELNLNLQGKGKFVWDLYRLVSEFKAKLKTFIAQLQEKDFTNFFPILESHQEEINDTFRFEQYIEKLIGGFDSRFEDFKNFSLAFQFIRNPLIFDESKAEELSEIFSVSKTSLNHDISLLAEEIQAKNESIDGMWRRLILDHSFLVLDKIIPKFLCMFGSTYVCEATFSSLVRRKSKYRTNLTENSLESEIRCELCTVKPDFHKLVENQQCHPSH